MWNDEFPPSQTIKYIEKDEAFMTQSEFYYQNSEAPVPNKPTRVGACVFLKYKNSIVLERRYDCGHWSLIGGGLEVNESLESCILREIKEETGLTIGNENLVFYKMYSDPSRIIKYPDGNIVRIITAAYIVEQDLMEELKCSDESLELKYVNLNDLDKYEIVATHRHIKVDKKY